jgi:hypothetical protein
MFQQTQTRRYGENQMTVNKTFRKVDKMVAESLPKSDTLFTYGKAHLYGINVIPNIDVVKIQESGDIYEMLQEPSADILVSAYDGFGVLTSGWAAPISDDDTPPSQSADRIRVRLFSYCDSDGKIHSSIRFGDNREMVYDENQARGSMRDAMADLHKASVAFKKIFESK